MVGAILKELEGSTESVFQFGKFNFLLALAASSDRILGEKKPKNFTARKPHPWLAGRGNKTSKKSLSQGKENIVYTIGSRQVYLMLVRKRSLRTASYLVNHQTLRTSSPWTFSLHLRHTTKVYVHQSLRM